MEFNFYTNSVNVETIQSMNNLMIDFDNGLVSLPMLASRLDTLRSSLLFMESEWNIEFDKNWTAIEIANAVSLDAGSLVVIPDQQDALKKGSAKLRSFLSRTFPSSLTS